MAPAFGDESDQQRRQLGINHGWKVERARTSWNTGLSLIAHSFSDAGDLQDQRTHFTMELPLQVVQGSEMLREESEWELEELLAGYCPMPTG